MTAPLDAKALHSAIHWARLNHPCTTEMAALILAAEAQIKAIEWQPIETAPKDGTRVILWWPTLAHGQIEVGSYRVDEMGFLDKDPHWFDDSLDDYSLGYSSRLLGPTHWMPLPPAPKGGGE